MGLYLPSHTPSYKQGYARNAAESAAPGLWKGLVGPWAPSLGPTGLTLRDLSGFGNHGTLTNMDPVTDWVTTGQRGIPWALDIDGTGDDYIAVAASPSIALHTKLQFSFSHWVFPRSVGQVSGRVWAKGNHLSYMANEAGGTVESFVSIDRNTTDTVSNPNNPKLNINQWNHLVHVYNADLDDRIYTYINGIKEVSGTNTAGSGTIVNDSASVFVFGNRIAENRSFDGLLANYGYWNRPLVFSEIQHLHKDPMAPLTPRIRIFPAAVAVPTGGVARMIFLTGEAA